MNMPARLRNVTWVMLGPEPFYGTCQRCGGTVAKPITPCPIDAFVAYSVYALELHERCQAPKPEAVAS